MLVAKSEAPTIGQLSPRPARKNCVLFSLAPLRIASDNPNAILPLTAIPTNDPI